MSLSLVIPARDDHAPLARLLAQASGLGIFDRAVVVDDGSDPPLGHDGLLPRGAGEDWLSLLRNDTPQGAGAARNRGMDAVGTTHLLCFDADDLLTPEIVPLWRDLGSHDFDICLFRHNDSRTSAAGGWGQMPLDEAIWRIAGVRGVLAGLAPAQRAALAETANYPWNKICRTDFLRENAIRCAGTQVHNDIPLHWGCLLAARRAFASERVAARHFVGRHTGRLTERRGAERLAVFDPLAEVAAAIRARDAEAFVLHFLRFASGLLDWIRSRLEPALLPAFDTRARAFLLTEADPAWFDRVIREDPALALRLDVQMLRGRP